MREVRNWRATRSILRPQLQADHPVDEAQRVGFAIIEIGLDDAGLHHLLEEAGDAIIAQGADAGYSSYGSLIQTSEKLVREKTDLVQRFVDASIEGWYSYLYDDPAPANALIKRDNPEMTDALLAYGIAKIKEYGIVDSGDAKKDGIGAMTEARWQAFFDTMAGAGVYPKELEFRKAFTLKFVDKKVGMKP